MSERAALDILLADVADGDQRAFRALYDATGSHLFGVLIRILRNRDWAEEALQDCYLKIWQKAETYTPERGAPLAWLTTVARYRALDLLRMKRPEDSLDAAEEAGETLATTGLDDEGAQAGPEVQAMREQGIGQLDDCLQTLRDEHRQCVLLAYYEGYTHSELTQVMNAPLGTIKGWVRRGLMKLKECLGE